MQSRKHPNDLKLLEDRANKETKDFYKQDFNEWLVMSGNVDKKLDTVTAQQWNHLDKNSPSPLS